MSEIDILITIGIKVTTSILWFIKHWISQSKPSSKSNILRFQLKLAHVGVTSGIVTNRIRKVTCIRRSCVVNNDVDGKEQFEW